jgi:hypothetical protein
MSMNTTAARIKMGYRKIGGLALAVMLAALIGGLSLAAPARADDDRGRNVQHARDQDHGHGDRDRGERHPVRGYHAEPSYVYAPPPVYYAPPAPSPGLSLIIPLNFR